jgi:type II secretory pathway component GspD/PulD (secretin)
MRKTLAGLSLLIAVAVSPTRLARAAERSAPRAASPSSGDSCRRLPEGKRLRLNLKPNTPLIDLVSWISAISCKQFVVPGELSSQSKTVTIVAPQPITVAEAYDLFLAALDAVGLTVYRSENVLRVVETSKIKSAPIPVYVDRERED